MRSKCYWNIIWATFASSQTKPAPHQVYETLLHKINTEFGIGLLGRCPDNSTEFGTGLLGLQP